MEAKQSKRTHFQGLKYESLDPADSQVPSGTQPSSWPVTHYISLRSKLWPFVGGLVTAFAITTFFILVTSISQSQPQTAEDLESEDWNQCGRSVEAALSQGCRMEPNFYGFFPERCVFPEFSANHPVFEDREWFSDVNLTQKITVADLWEGKHVKVYTQRMHSEHCMFQWRKLRYGMENKLEWLDTKTFSSHHAKHCADQLSVGCEGWDSKTELELGFYHCKKTIW